MIEIFCRNRLGNVLFLYAVGRHLAVKNNTGVRLHLAGRNGQDKFMLDQLSYFNLQAEVLIAGSEGYISLPPVGESLSRDNVFVESEWGFNPEVLTLKDGVHLDGNFQCEQYFTDIEQLIRQELKINAEILDRQGSNYLREIQGTNSIAIHVRRGDYLNLKLHHVCNSRYYANAVEYMCACLDAPNFFVFSDDIRWCKDNFVLPDCTFVDLPGSKDNPVLDFKLMSLCKHSIIANSTFSWWTAWLSTFPDKVIVGPKHWFYDEANLDWVIRQDTIPDDWVRIEF